MSLLMHIPITDGMVICADKRHIDSQGYQDDAVKLAQVNDAWLLVFIGTVGFGKSGRVPIEGFRTGSRPDADCAIAELVARFCRTNPPPTEGIATPWARRETWPPYHPYSRDDDYIWRLEDSVRSGLTEHFNRFPQDRESAVKKFGSSAESVGENPFETGDVTGM